MFSAEVLISLDILMVWSYDLLINFQLLRNKNVLVHGNVQVMHGINIWADANQINGLIRFDHKILL